MSRPDVPLRPDQIVDARIWAAMLNAMAGTNATARTIAIGLGAAHSDDSPAVTGKAHIVAVDLDRQIATLNGTPFDVKSLLALRWLKILADRPGVWISGRELEQYDAELAGAKTDRLKSHLPKAVLELIDSETGRGSRLRLS